MSNQPTEGSALRAALASELERRRGHAPEPGEIFVLTETAELPVEWALLEARPLAFLAVPADVQPLAGSRDLALGANVLSGPLVLRCGHAVLIAAARLRPELRTGLLDPATLTAARALHAILAAGTADLDPLGEEIDRDPEYRDWVEEVLDPARAAMAGLAGEGREEKEHPWGGEVVEMGDWREKRRDARERSDRPTRSERSGFLRVLPWLAAACLALAFGWTGTELRRLRQLVSQPRFDEPNLPLDTGTVRGESEFSVPPPGRLPGERVRISGYVPADLPKALPMVLVLLDKQRRELVRGLEQTRNPSSEWSMTFSRSKLSPGPYRVELRAEDGEVLASWGIRVLESPPAR